MTAGSQRSLLPPCPDRHSVCEQVVDLPHGHLVPYPIQVHEDGTVTAQPSTFPDTQAWWHATHACGSAPAIAVLTAHLCMSQASVLGAVWKLFPFGGQLREKVGGPCIIIALHGSPCSKTCLLPPFSKKRLLCF